MKSRSESSRNGVRVWCGFSWWFRSSGKSAVVSEELVAVIRVKREACTDTTVSTVNCT
jgi:hypothetical protein